MAKKKEKIEEQEELEEKKVVEIEEEIIDESLEPEKKEVKEEIDDKIEEPPKFTLAKPDEPEKSEEDEKTEIVHNGQVYKLTKDKIIELAQKGFDYDSKVGPHGKLVKMIEADPNLSKVVDDYWQGKVSGPGKKIEVTPVADYEDETEWLQDNLQQVLQLARETSPTPKVEQEAAPQGGTMADALRMRDPEFFNQIYPKLDSYAEKLTMADYRKVDADMGALCQFYDFVKEQEFSKKKVRETKPPGFRVKSGGGEAPRADSGAPAWELSKEEFQKQLDKIKGYS